MCVCVYVNICMYVLMCLWARLLYPGVVSGGCYIRDAGCERHVDPVPHDSATTGNGSLMQEHLRASKILQILAN